MSFSGDGSIVTALAALAGTAVGGFTSVIAGLLSHRLQVRAQWFAHENNRRQVLYREFIEEASKCYIDALQNDKAGIPALVGLYAKLGRMRVLSSDVVVEAPTKSPNESWIPIWNRTRALSSFGIWQKAGPSTFCISSVWRAARNSSAFAPSSFSTPAGYLVLSSLGALLVQRRNARWGGREGDSGEQT